MAHLSTYFSLEHPASSHDAKELKRELDTLPGVTSVSDSGGRLFYLQGGYAPEKLGFFYRMMMKPMASSVIRQVEGKGDAATAQEREMAEVFRNGGDFVRREALDEIVQWFREGDHTGEVKAVPRVEF